MNPALASLLALLFAIVLSMVSRINVGFVALALAWLVGVGIAGMKPEAVMAGFPATLFLTLTGVSLLFACAETNGVLKVLTERILQLVRGHSRWLPLLFFAIACFVSTIGPGAISGVALVIPLALAIGARAQVSPLLTMLMVGNGANAGNLSPISVLGVIANTKMEEAGLGKHAGKVWFANFVAHALVALLAWVLFGRKQTNQADETYPEDASALSLTRAQWLTVAVIALWIAGAVFLKLNLGLSAFVAVSVLLLLHAADENATVKQVPWGVLLMVCGVSTLIALLEKTGGLEQFTALLARVGRPATINGLMAFVTGVISSYSSTSGVVMPAFLPIAPKLVAQIGGGDPLALALSVNVGSALVDVSPLSTIGALCLAPI
ncbi:MAG: C4-dicarboxylate ABC transporter, partial [Acidobacteria bacterium]|nr:C4-dicarboxylate ABC transporter [Acidobacteriota bacterium]